MSKRIESAEANAKLDELGAYIQDGETYRREFDRNAGVEEINAAWDERGEFEKFVVEEWDGDATDLRKVFRLTKSLVENRVGMAIQKAMAA